MGTYKNNYSEKEDSTLWELHEIRHRLHQSRKDKSIEEINKEALRKYEEWQEEREKREMVTKKRA